MEAEKPHLNRNFTVLLAFFLPAAIFLLILASYRILPFGETTLLFSDLDSQYVEFMAEYCRVLLGQGSLTYSWNAGLGMNFVAIIAYYLASPFNFLLVLFPEEGLPLAVSVLTVLKLGAVGAAFGFYLSRQKLRNAWELIPALSACYALSTWALGYAFNIMWLDALIWLPLLCAAIDRLLDDGRFGMTVLIPLFGLSFISQFYTAYMTGLFCALYFLAGCFIRKLSFREFLRRALRFGISVGIAAGLSAFLLLPTFFVLKNNMGLMGQEVPATEGAFPPGHLLKMLFWGSFDWIKGSLPHIYGGLPMLIGLILFFMASDVSRREKAAAVCIGVFLLFSFWFKPLDFLWHAMDHPSWFPYRYAFLFPFWGLGCAYRGLSGERTLKKTLTACGICLCLLLTACWVSGAWTFAFTGVNALFLLLYGILLLPVSVRFGYGVLALICSVELLLNGGMIIGKFGYTKLPDYQNFYGHYRELVEPLLPEAGQFYRMEKTETRNYNDPLGVGFPGVSHFSSTASTRQAQFLRWLGYNCYATWCTYQGSTVASDMLLGIRYEFGDAGKADSVQVGTQRWEHPAQFPLFFFADESFARYDYFADEGNAITRQNDLLLLLDGSKEDYFEEIPVEIVSVVGLTPDEVRGFVQSNPESPAYIDLVIHEVDGKSVYLYIPGASLNYHVTANENYRLMNANSDYIAFPMCLDAYFVDGIANIRVEAVSGSMEGEFIAYAIDPQRLLSLSETVNAAAPRMERTGNTTFVLSTEAADMDRLVVSSISFDAGWQVTANGQRQPLKMIHESMLGFVLPAGCEEVTVSFSPYGAQLGLILTACALLMWAGIWWIEKRRKI